MPLSNYEIMRNQMRKEFIKYDQEKMIQKFKLNFDEDFLYLDFMCRNYRINRKNGIVEWTKDCFHSVIEADYNESMTIYDVLCYSKDNCQLSGNFCPIHMAKGIVKTLYTSGNIFQKAAAGFQGHINQLKYACNVLGKTTKMVGDVAAILWVFPFLPVTFQYWEGDEEFSPSLKFMFDENILDYMHFETVQFMTAHMLSRIGEIMNEYVETQTRNNEV